MVAANTLAPEFSRKAERKLQKKKKKLRNSSFIQPNEKKSNSNINRIEANVRGNKSGPSVNLKNTAVLNGRISKNKKSSKVQIGTHKAPQGPNFQKNSAARYAALKEYIKNELGQDKKVEKKSAKDFNSSVKKKPGKPKTNTIKDKNKLEELKNGIDQDDREIHFLQRQLQYNSRQKKSNNMFRNIFGSEIGDLFEALEAEPTEADLLSQKPLEAPKLPNIVQKQPKVELPKNTIFVETSKIGCEDPVPDAKLSCTKTTSKKRLLNESDKDVCSNEEPKNKIMRKSQVKCNNILKNDEINTKKSVSLKKQNKASQNETAPEKTLKSIVNTKSKKFQKKKKSLNVSFDFSKNEVRLIPPIVKESGFRVMDAHMPLFCDIDSDSKIDSDHSDENSDDSFSGLSKALEEHYDKHANGKCSVTESFESLQNCKKIKRSPNAISQSKLISDSIGKSSSRKKTKKVQNENRGKNLEKKNFEQKMNVGTKSSKKLRHTHEVSYDGEEESCCENENNNKTGNSSDMLSESESDQEDAGSDLDNTGSDEKDSEIDLEDSDSDLEDAESDLEDAESDLEDAESDLEDAESDLEDAESDLEDADSDLEDAGTNSCDVDKVKQSGFSEDIYGRTRDSAGNLVEITASEDVLGYLTPAKRKLDQALQEQLSSDAMKRVRTQLRGRLNRLAEANLAGAVTMVCTLYETHPRHLLNVVLSELLLAELAGETLTLERHCQECAVLLTALASNVAEEIAAHIITDFVMSWHEEMEKGSDASCTRLRNCLMFMCHLFSFGLLHSVLIYDLLSKLTTDFSTSAVEQMMMVVGSVGFLLRKEDPLALRDFIVAVQSKGASSDMPQLQLLHTMLRAVKNNNESKMPDYDPTYTEHLRKLLKSYVGGDVKVTPLRVTLDDLLHSETRGRWWIVGSAYSGLGALSKPSLAPGPSKVSATETKFSADFMKMAESMRISRPPKINILFALTVGSESVAEAIVKLKDLSLPPNQEKLIFDVMLFCIQKMRVYKPFYAILSIRLCVNEGKYKRLLQHALWDKFSDLDALKVKELKHLAKFIVHTVKEDALNLSVLKTLPFVNTNRKIVDFLEDIFCQLFTDEGGDQVSMNAFEKLFLSKKLEPLRRQFSLFLQLFMLPKCDAGELDSRCRARVLRVVDMLGSDGGVLF